MCGVFGLITGYPSDENENLFFTLMKHNADRGDRGNGVMYARRGSLPLVIKHTLPIEEMLVDDVATLGHQNFMLGHTIAPTNGDEVDAHRLHPFASERFVLAHNGILLNHDSLAGWQIEGLPDVDSVRILGGLEFFASQGEDTANAIALTCAALEGQYACWVYDKATQDVYLFRCMSTLYFHSTNYNTTFYFSSADVDGAVLLPEGIVYRVRLLKDHVFAEKVATFPFSTPYAVQPS